VVVVGVVVVVVVVVGVVEVGVVVVVVVDVVVVGVVVVGGVVVVVGGVGGGVAVVVPELVVCAQRVLRLFPHNVVRPVAMSGVRVNPITKRARTTGANLAWRRAWCMGAAPCALACSPLVSAVPKPR
jgi:hypothetical protein